MSHRLLNALCATTIVVVVTGCGRDLLPVAVATPPSISITQLNHPNQGFIGPGPALVAAPSLVDLLGLVHSLGAFPRFDDCAQYVFRVQCWQDIKDPGNSLLLAAVVDEPCAPTQSVTAALSESVKLTITVANRAGCLNGGGSAPLPYLSLVSIPLSQLPADEVTVVLVHTGVSNRTAKMMVDLRRPLNIGTDEQTRMNEVGAAVAAASDDASTRLSNPAQYSFRALGTDRWTDTSLGCPVPGHSYAPADARGYVLFFSVWDRQPQLDMEYHVSGHTLAFCGRVAY